MQKMKKKHREIMIFAIVSAVSLVCLVNYYPIGIDWKNTYSPGGILHPYKTEGFVSPPWTFLLLPHRLLPLRWGNAVNFYLNIAVLLYAIKKLRGGTRAALLVFTSPVFFDLARTNNIEWLPLLGLLIDPWFGGVLLACKPQCLSLAFVIWAKRDKNVLVLPLVTLALSFVLWGWWPGKITFAWLDAPFNFSVLPIGIPFGLWMLYSAWKKDDEYLAAVSTALLTPYIAPYSLVSVLAVLACKRRGAATWLYFGLWAYAIIEARRLG